MVRSRRLELPRVAPQRPQRCASTNSATTARHDKAGLDRPGAISKSVWGAQVRVQLKWHYFEEQAKTQRKSGGRSVRDLIHADHHDDPRRTSISVPADHRFYSRGVEDRGWAGRLSRR